MKTHTRLVSLITLGATLGFMLSATSCKSTVASAQKQFDQVSAKYESASGISTQQTVSLVGKWWQDYQKAKELKALLDTDIIQATKASPVTSTKDVIDVRPVTSFVAPPQPAPAKEPAEAQPKKHERPSPRDPPQMIATN